MEQFLPHHSPARSICGCYSFLCLRAAVKHAGASRPVPACFFSLPPKLFYILEWNLLGRVPGKQVVLVRLLIRFAIEFELKLSRRLPGIHHPGALLHVVLISTPSFGRNMRSSACISPSPRPAHGPANGYNETPTFGSGGHDEEN